MGNTLPEFDSEGDREEDFSGNNGYDIDLEITSINDVKHFLYILISQSVTPGFTIMGLLYNDYTIAFYKKLKKLAVYKSGFNIDCFHISNKIYDVSLNDFQNDNKNIDLDIGIIEEYVLKIKNHTDIINSLSNNDYTYEIVNAQQIIENY